MWYTVITMINGEGRWGIWFIIYHLGRPYFNLIQPFGIKNLIGSDYECKNCPLDGILNCENIIIIIIIFLYFKKVTQLTNKLISPVAFNTKLVNKK